MHIEKDPLTKKPILVVPMEHCSPDTPPEDISHGARQCFVGTSVLMAAFFESE